MKRGFTLIELLAVIIILALLMIVAVPNVLETLNSAKKQTFVTQAQSIYKTAQQQWTKDMMKGTTKKEYNSNSSKLDLSKGSDTLNYCMTISDSGKVTKIIVDDGNYRIETNGGIDSIVSSSVSESTGELNCNVKTEYLDGVIPVAPELGSLIPIKYNGTNWVYADSSEKWYHYGNREWANAVVLADGVTKSVNDTISENDIALWFVWVPRYEYKLPENSIGVRTAPEAIDVKFISSNISTPTEGYSFHPGFKFGDSWKNGLWMGKFESTSDVVSGTGANTVKKFTIKANSTSWRNVQPVNLYLSSLGLVDYYSMSGLDTHASRYTEWTTMSYLSNTIYGRCSNATTCVEITINKIEGKTDETDDSSYITGGGNYKTNIDQSSTGNIYGIYDMNGGAWEYVMGYLKDDVDLYTHSGFSDATLPTDYKYADIFTSLQTNKNSYVGIYTRNGETSMNGVYKELLKYTSNYFGWYDDDHYAIYAENPWFTIGGDWSEGKYGGAFATFCSFGKPYHTAAFRVAAVKK